jgi:hypothetical protein
VSVAVPCETAIITYEHPMCFSKIGCRPLRRMVGMGVIEPGNLQPFVSREALDSHQLDGSDMVAVVRRIRPRVSCPGRLHHPPSLSIGLPRSAPQHS